MTFMFMHLRNGAVDADAPRETPLREGRNCGVGSAFLFLLFSVRHTRAIFAFQGGSGVVQCAPACRNGTPLSDALEPSKARFEDLLTPQAVVDRPFPRAKALASAQASSCLTCLLFHSASSPKGTP